MKSVLLSVLLQSSVLLCLLNTLPVCSYPLTLFNPYNRDFSDKIDELINDQLQKIYPASLSAEFTNGNFRPSPWKSVYSRVVAQTQNDVLNRLIQHLKLESKKRQDLLNKFLKSQEKRNNIDTDPRDLLGDQWLDLLESRKDGHPQNKRENVKTDVKRHFWESMGGPLTAKTRLSAEFGSSNKDDGNQLNIGGANGFKGMRYG